MAEIRTFIRFLLNDRIVELDDVAATDTLLDFLRLKQRMCGTKEGCAEGDCGACTVLVGRLTEGKLVYETVNACIRFVGTLDACHVVTIEHLRGQDGSLHPVQQAMVDCHGSQCGFCTPGIVMSLYSLWMSNPNPSNADIETSLQGNLCRCTGYEAIIRAALVAASAGGQEDDALVCERETVAATLEGLADGARIEISAGDEAFFVPAYGRRSGRRAGRLSGLGDCCRRHRCRFVGDQDDAPHRTGDLHQSSRRVAPDRRNRRPVM